jgi:hypothetical protein
MATVIIPIIISTIDKVIQIFRDVYNDIKHKKNNDKSFENLPIYIQSLTEKQQEEFINWLIEESNNPDIKLNHPELTKQLKQSNSSDIQTIDKHKLLFDKWQKINSN